MNVAEMLYSNARKYPEKEAIVFKDLRFNYREMDHLSNQFANALINLGIKKGDRIAIMMRNSEKYVAVYFGILKAGAIVVPINISLMKNEVQFIINNCEAKAFVFDPIFWPVLNGIEKELPLVKDFICSNGIEVQDFKIYQEMINSSSIDAPPVTINEEDICSIIYTSGTTGTPRCYC